MNKVGKLFAYLIFVFLICTNLHLYDISTNDWLYWIVSVPTFVGANWIVEKLDKIK